MKRGSGSRRRGREERGEEETRDEKRRKEEKESERERKKKSHVGFPRGNAGADYEAAGLNRNATRCDATLCTSIASCTRRRCRYMQRREKSRTHWPLQCPIIILHSFTSLVSRVCARAYVYTRAANRHRPPIYVCVSRQCATCDIGKRVYYHQRDAMRRRCERSGASDTRLLDSRRWNTCGGRSFGVRR